MFKVKGQDLQSLVGGLTRGARKARLGESHVFIEGNEDEVRFYFVGEDLQVEKVLPAKVEKPFACATTMAELDIKVMALPDDEEITVELDGNLLYLKWARSSQIAVVTVPETAPMIDIPKGVDSVMWKPGYVQVMARSLPPFTALPNSKIVNDYPVMAGLYISKDNETDEVFVRATDRARAVTVNARGMEWFDGIHASIPIETVMALADILASDSEVNVQINEQRTLLVFESGRTKAVSRLLIGDFPPIDNAYTKRESAESEWIFDRLELLETARRVKRLAGAQPFITFNVDGSKVMAELPGTLVQQIGAAVEGKKFPFKVHADYLEVALTMFRTEEVQVLFAGEQSPLTIVCEETDDVKTLIAQAIIE